MDEAIEQDLEADSAKQVEYSSTSSTRWFVVQVRSGQEHRMCKTVVAACREYELLHHMEQGSLLDECFSPRFRGQKKWKHAWRDVEYPLMPGYVIAVSDVPDKLAGVLRRLDELCRLMTTGETYLPLADNERSWIERQTHKGDRAVPMSFGYQEGGRLVVMEGPLKGEEARIARIDRRNSLAHLEFHVGSMRIKTNVGLAIVPKR